jgi:hypothetical protein
VYSVGTLDGASGGVGFNAGNAAGGNGRNAASGQGGNCSGGSGGAPWNSATGDGGGAGASGAGGAGGGVLIQFVKNMAQVTAIPKVYFIPANIDNRGNVNSVTNGGTIKIIAPSYSTSAITQTGKDYRRKTLFATMAS